MAVDNRKADGNDPKGGEAATVGRVFEPLRALIATRREPWRADSAETARARLARDRMDTVSERERETRVWQLSM